MATAKKFVWCSALTLILSGVGSLRLLAQTRQQSIDLTQDALPKLSAVINEASGMDDGVLDSPPDFPHASADRQESHQHDGPETRRGLPVLRDADETAWVANAEYYFPQSGFDRLNSDIDVENLRVAHAWHFPAGWEFRAFR